MLHSFTRERLAGSLRGVAVDQLWRFRCGLRQVELAQLHKWFGLRDCGCTVGHGLVIDPCGRNHVIAWYRPHNLEAGAELKREKCGCPVGNRVHCPHRATDWEDPVLPAWAQTWLLWRLWPEEYGEPPSPAGRYCRKIDPDDGYSTVRKKERMARVMAKRAERCRGLRHRLDFIRRDLGAIDDRLGRPITRGHDGRDIVGEIHGGGHGDADGQGDEGAGAAGEPDRGRAGEGGQDRPGGVPRPGKAA